MISNPLYLISFLISASLANSALATSLITHNIKILTSSSILIPFATYKKSIVIPENMENILSRKEFEAVVAHELEHIRNFDPYIRIFYQFLAAFFWWLPTNSWIKKLEQDQEMACDHSVLNYGLNKESIASAILKLTRHVKAQPNFCCLVDSKHPIKRTHTKSFRYHSIYTWKSNYTQSYRFPFRNLFPYFLPHFLRKTKETNKKPTSLLQM